MSPIEQGVGYSKYTPSKQQIYKSIVDMHLAITLAVMSKHAFVGRDYLYIDATAGPGIYGKKGKRIVGSPIIFISVINGKGSNFQIHLIDENPINIRKLSKLLSGCNKDIVHIHPGSYNKILPRILGHGDNKQLGLLYVDTTGIPEWGPIKSAIQLFPMLEVLIHVSATALKRVPDEPSLENTLTDLGKRNWVIRRPFKWDNNQWTFLLGSNSDLFKKYKKIEFFTIDSPEAREFMQRMNLTRAELELQGQTDFLDLIPNDSPKE